MTGDPTLTEPDRLDRVAKALRDSERTLDGQTLARLRAARERALAGAGRGPVRRWALPAALAAGALAWLVVPRQALVPEALPVNVVAADALDVLTDELGPEFYENLDLYRWLEGEGSDSA